MRIAFYTLKSYLGRRCFHVCNQTNISKASSWFFGTNDLFWLPPGTKFPLVIDEFIFVISLLIHSSWILTKGQTNLLFPAFPFHSSFSLGWSLLSGTDMLTTAARSASIPTSKVATNKPKFTNSLKIFNDGDTLVIGGNRLSTGLATNSIFLL